MTRRLMTSIALVALLSMTLQLALAASASAAELSRTPVEFVLTPEQCPDVETTITGAGMYFLRHNERIDKNGVTHINDNLSAKGTAVGENGVVYHFNYHNNARVTIPPQGFPFTIRQTDHFNLVGAGNAGNMQVGFNVIVTFLAPGEDPIIEEISVHGNPACDVI